MAGLKIGRELEPEAAGTLRGRPSDLREAGPSPIKNPVRPNAKKLLQVRGARRRRLGPGRVPRNVSPYGDSISRRPDGSVWTLVLEDADLEVVEPEEGGAFVMANDREKFDTWVIDEVVQFARPTATPATKKTATTTSSLQASKSSPAR